jgi:hypothetical protein
MICLYIAIKYLLSISQYKSTQPPLVLYVLSQGLHPASQAPIAFRRQWRLVGRECGLARCERGGPTEGGDIG